MAHPRQFRILLKYFMLNKKYTFDNYEAIILEAYRIHEVVINQRSFVGFMQKHIIKCFIFLQTFLNNDE